MIKGKPPRYMRCVYCEDEGKTSMAKYVKTTKEDLSSLSEEERKAILDYRPLALGHEYKCPECGLVMSKAGYD